jgi:hypothetical protein
LAAGIRQRHEVGDAEESNKQLQHLSPHDESSVIEHIRAQTFILESTQLPTWIAPGPKWPAAGVVAFRNGLLHLDGYL